MKKLLVALSILLSTNAFAGVLLEPYIGYNIGGTDQSGQVDSDLKGEGYGLRLGWKLPFVFVALDYSMSNITSEKSGQADEDGDLKNFGVVVGASLPMVRVWAGYNFSAVEDLDTTGKYTGNGMKAGIGFKIPVLPISINAEYIISKYDELSDVALTNDVDSKMLFLSLSAPLSL